MLRPDRRRSRPLRSHGENGHPLDRFAGSLRVEIERPQRLDIVFPPLEPHRCRHPKPVHVEDPTAHAELRHFGDGRDANVAHRLQPLDRVAEGPAPRSLLPLRQTDPRGRRGAGPPRPPGGGGGGRPRPRPLPRQQQLQRLYALPRDLEMRLFGAQRLALRIQSRRGPRQGPQIREPPLRISRRGCDHDKDPLCKPSRQRGQQHGGTRAGEAGDTLTRAGRGQTLRERACRGEGIQPVDDEVERHQRVRVATPSSTTAHSSASTSSSPEPSRRPAPANRAAANAAPSSTSALSTSCTSSGDAGVRSDSRGSSPYTVAPTASAPRLRNSTPGAPSTSQMGASPRAKRFTSASTNGTKAGDAGSAVHAVSSRLPMSRTLPSRTSHGSPFTVASTVLSSPIRRPASPVMGSIRYLRVTCRPASAGTAGPPNRPGGPPPPDRPPPPPAAGPPFSRAAKAGPPETK